MMRLLVPLAAGLLFGAGLIVSDMANPQRVLAFLTLGATWDPTLIFVMGGAMVVAAVGFALTGRRESAWDGSPLPAVNKGPIDSRLIIGGALFGLGWGLSGYCPGPAIVAAGIGSTSAWILLPSMLIAGWITGRVIDRGS